MGSGGGGGGVGGIGHLRATSAASADDDLVNLGSTFGRDTHLGSTFGRGMTGTIKVTANGAVLRRGISFEAWDAVKAAYARQQARLRRTARQAVRHSKEKTKERSAETFRRYSKRYLRDVAVGALRNLYEENLCSAVPSARGGGCVPDKTCLATLVADPAHMSCASLGFECRAQDKEAWMKVGRALAAIELVCGEGEEPGKSRSKLPGGDTKTARKPQSLGPLGQAWIQWTKASRRVFEDVVVSMEDAATMQNRDEDGQLSQTVGALRYAPRSGEMKLLRGRKMDQRGGFERLHFVLDDVKPHVKAANRIYHEQCLKAWRRCLRHAAEQLNAERDGKRSKKKAASSQESDGEADRMAAEKRGDAASDSRDAEAATALARRALRQLQEWGDADIGAKERAVQDLNEKSSKEALRMWQGWHDAKKRGELEVPVELPIAKSFRSAMPLAYVGAGNPVPPGGQQYMRAGNRVSVPAVNSAMAALMAGRRRAWAMRSTNPHDPVGEDLRASRTLIERLKGLHAEAEEQRAARLEEASMKFRSWAAEKDRLAQARKLLAAVDRDACVRDVVARDDIGLALHAIDVQLFDVWLQWVLRGTVESGDPVDRGILDPYEERVRRDLLARWRRFAGPMRGPNTLVATRMTAAKQEAWSLRERAYLTLGGDDPIDEDHPEFAMRYDASQADLAAADEVLRKARGLYRVQSITFLDGHPAEPREVPVLNEWGRADSGLEAHAVVAVGDAVNLDGTAKWWDVLELDWRKKTVLVQPSKDVRSIGTGALLCRLVPAGQAAAAATAEEEEDDDEEPLSPREVADIRQEARQRGARAARVQARLKRRILFSDLINTVVYRKTLVRRTGAPPVFFRVPRPSRKWGVDTLRNKARDDKRRRQQAAAEALRKQQQEGLDELEQWRDSVRPQRVLFGRAALRKLDPQRATSYDEWREVGAALYLLSPGPCPPIATAEASVKADDPSPVSDAPEGFTVDKPIPGLEGSVDAPQAVDPGPTARERMLGGGVPSGNLPGDRPFVLHRPHTSSFGTGMLTPATATSIGSASADNEQMLSEWPARALGGSSAALGSAQLSLSEDGSSSGTTVDRAAEASTASGKAPELDDDGSQQTTETDVLREEYGPGSLFVDWVRWTMSTPLWSTFEDHEFFGEDLLQVCAREWRGFREKDPEVVAKDNSSGGGSNSSSDGGGGGGGGASKPEGGEEDAVRGGAAESKGFESLLGDDDKAVGSDSGDASSAAAEAAADNELVQRTQVLLESEERTDLATKMIWEWVEHDGGWGSDSDEEPDTAADSGEGYDAERAMEVAQLPPGSYGRVRAAVRNVSEESVTLVWGDARTRRLRIGIHADDAAEDAAAVAAAIDGITADGTRVLRYGPGFVLEMELPHDAAVALSAQAKAVFGGPGAARVPHFVEVYRGFAGRCVVTGLVPGTQYRFRVRRSSASEEDSSGLPNEVHLTGGFLSRALLSGSSGSDDSGRDKGGKAKDHAGRVAHYVLATTTPATPSQVRMLCVDSLGDTLANWIELTWTPSVSRSYQRQHSGAAMPWQERDRGVPAGAWARFVRYVVQCQDTRADESSWYTVYSGRRPRAVVGAFESGKRYRFRVCAVADTASGPAAASGFSPVLAVSLRAPRVRSVGSDSCTLSWTRLLRDSDARGAAPSVPPATASMLGRASPPPEEVVQAVPPSVESDNGDDDSERSFQAVPRDRPDSLATSPESAASPASSAATVPSPDAGAAGDDDRAETAGAEEAAAGQGDARAASDAGIAAEVEEVEEAIQHTPRSDDAADDEWRPVFDPRTMRVYYFNPRLQKSVWRVPKDARLAGGGWNAHLAANDIDPETGLPTRDGQSGDAGGDERGSSDEDGASKPARTWVEIWDPRRQLCYYYSTITGETRWTVPSDADEAEREGEDTRSTSETSGGVAAAQAEPGSGALALAASAAVDASAAGASETAEQAAGEGPTGSDAETAPTPHSIVQVQRSESGRTAEVTRRLSAAADTLSAAAAAVAAQGEQGAAEEAAPRRRPQKLVSSLVAVHRELHWDVNDGAAPRRPNEGDAADSPRSGRSVDPRFAYAVILDGPLRMDRGEVVESGDKQPMVVFSGHAGACIVRGLQPNAVYRLQVRAVDGTSKLRGKPSEPAYIATLPSPPADIELGKLTSSSAELRWKAGRGGADRYAVLVARLPAAAAAWVDDTGELPPVSSLGAHIPHFELAYQGRKAHTVLSGLAPQQSYIVRVYALNAAKQRHDDGDSYAAALDADDGSVAIVTTPAVARRRRRKGQPIFMQP